MTEENSADIAGLFEDAAKSAVSENARDEASRLVEELAAAEYAVAKLEVLLSEKKQVLNELRTKKVPDAMLQANQMAFTVALGNYAEVSVEIVDFVSGSLPKGDEARGIAIDWLEQHDGKDLIKDELTIVFQKSEHNMALDLLHRLKEEGFTCSFGSNVHHSTLQAWARERLRHGEELDPDVLGLYVGRIAKLEWPKDKLPKVRKS